MGAFTLIYLHLHHVVCGKLALTNIEGQTIGLECNLTHGSQYCRQFLSFLFFKAFPVLLNLQCFHKWDPNRQLKYAVNLNLAQCKVTNKVRFTHTHSSNLYHTQTITISSDLCPPIAWHVLTHTHPCYSNCAHVFKNSVMCITRPHQVLVGSDK